MFKSVKAVAASVSRRMPRRMLVTAAFLACAFGAFTVGSVWATAGSGITTTILSGPAVLGEVHLNSDSDVNDVKIKTKGLSDVYVVLNRIAPGGHTGWHGHPGPSIISVVSGQATEYTDDSPFGIVHPAGTCFADEGSHAHIVVNEGETDLVVIAFQILPKGAPRRIDMPAPW